MPDPFNEALPEDGPEPPAIPRHNLAHRNNIRSPNRSNTRVGLPAGAEPEPLAEEPPARVADL